MKKLLAITLCALLIFSLAACAAPAPASSGANLTKVSLVLDWAPNTNHTGIYVAENLDYYKDAGIDLEIIQPPEEGALSILASGQVQYAITFQEEMAFAISSANPLPIKAVATIIEHNTSGLISLKDKNILTPKDLEGKRVAIWESPLVYSIFESIMEKHGGDYDKIQFVPTNVTDVVSALTTNIDVVWIYKGWDGIAVDLAGLETNYMDFASLDPTFDFYTPIIATNIKYADENPALVKAFIAATEKGYEYAINNPKEAADILCSKVPELDPKLISASQAYLATQYQADAAKWGRIDTARWAGFYDWMYQQKLLENPLGEKGFTNEFFPQ